MKVSFIFQGKPLCYRLLQEHNTFNIFSLLRIFRTNALNVVVKINKGIWRKKRQDKLEPRLDCVYVRSCFC